MIRLLSWPVTGVTAMSDRPSDKTTNDTIMLTIRLLIFHLSFGPIDSAVDVYLIFTRK